MIRTTTLLATCFITVLAHAVQVAASVQPARCGLSNGSAWATASGGLPPYAFSWSNGPTTQSNPDLAPGEYIVSVTDGLSNTDQDTVIVEAVWELAESTYPGQADCGGSCSGHVIIQLDYLGGTAPYTYSLAWPWINESGNQAEVVGVCASTPTNLTVTDVNGCAVDMELFAYGIWPYQHTASNITPECEGEANGTITMSGSFGGPVTYMVTYNGGTPQYLTFTDAPYTLTGLAAGDYDIQPVWDDGSGNYQYPYCEFGSQVTVEQISAPCGSVSGKVFNDVDQDCTQDVVDIALPYRVLTIDPGPSYAITDVNGHYYTAIPTGSFTITQPLVYEAQLCPAQVPAPFAVDLLAPNAVVDLADSSLQPHDLSVYLWSWGAQPGFTHKMFGSIQNLSAYPSGEVTVTLNYDPLLTPTQISPPPSSVVPGTVQWTFASLGAYAYQGLAVRTNVPADIGLLGYVLNSTLTETNTAVESSDLNNSASLATTVTGSYDPNDKVARTSSGLSNTSYFLDEDNYIDYTIRFQNTGTAYAQNVIVRDSLQADLDPATLEILGASHTFTPSFENGRTLVFTFTNIQLPDSGSNEPGSHGTIHFRIKPRADITVGEVISNSAGIYFDFNPPVITEPSELLVEMSTQVQEQGQEHLRVFPVPAVDELRLVGRELIAHVQILAVDGRTITALPFHGGSIDVSALAPGSYFLRATFQNEEQRTVRFEKH